MTNRPSTSRPRGICRYYNTPRGCLAGTSCKFLHGSNETLTPYDKGKICKFYTAGYCRRGTDCWFRHVAPTASASQDGAEAVPQHADDVCGICLEKPVTYGLLSECSHIFCVGCIRSWRDQKDKSDIPVETLTNKRCPYCRAPSGYILPSSHYFPHGHPGKTAALNRYKESTARIPCKYFQGSPPRDRFCPYGRDCLYKHQNADGTPYVFPRGAHYYIQNFPQRFRNARNNERIPDNPLLDNLSNLFRDVRMALEGVYRAVRDGSLTIQPSATDDTDITSVTFGHVLDEQAPDVISEVQQLEASSSMEVPWRSDSSMNPHGVPSESLPQTSTSPGMDGTLMEIVGTVSLLERPSYIHTGAEQSTITPSPTLSPLDIHSPLSIEQSDSQTDISSITGSPRSLLDANTNAYQLLHLGTEPDGFESNSPEAINTPVSPTPVALCVTPFAASIDDGTPDDSVDSIEAREPSSPRGEPVPEPPFLTDGRGRVVWSRPGSKRGVSSSTLVTPDS